MRKLNLLILFATLSSVLAWGQTAASQEKHPAHHEEAFRHFRVAALIGHTSVPSGTSHDHLFIPSWGLDLEYWFNRKWGLGIHNDIELHTFIIEENHSEFLERDYPLVSTLDLLFKPVKDFVLFAGPGCEFEKNENFKLVRFGAEYEFEIPGGWDISPAIFYDTRFDAFDTWSVALGVGKRF